MLGCKLRRVTSKTKQLVPVQVDSPLFWTFHCETCIPVCVILYHVMESCKGPVALIIPTEHDFCVVNVCRQAHVHTEFKKCIKYSKLFQRTFPNVSQNKKK